MGGGVGWEQGRYGMVYFWYISKAKIIPLPKLNIPETGLIWGVTSAGG